MLRCIQLAKNGLGTTYPNPLVGSVIVHKNSIIGEGWHYKAGMPHAEVNAIKRVADTSLLKNATIYVSLEPCSHFGKTPPCANLIIESGIKRVVIGSTDPNPKVAGKGIKRMIEAGCEVIIGVLEKQCNDLNKRFFTFHNKKRPYIFLKWAQTKNGFIAPNPDTRKETKPVWITSAYTRQFVHKMRSEEQAILVGTNTVLQDNPSLTVRDWFGQHPVRLLIDRSLKIPKYFTIFNEESNTVVFTEKTKTIDNKYFVEIDFSKDLALQICEFLYSQEIQSLIVEGGAKTLQTFIDANMWDEIYIFSGQKSFEKGIKAPIFQGNAMEEKTFHEDRLQIYKNLAP